jgi:preprotein translocase SecE subunit
VARDRQRAKQRQRRRQPSGGSGSGQRSSRARDIGLDDSSVEDSGLEGAPEATEPEATEPDVDEAVLEAEEDFEADGDLGETDPAVLEEREERRRPKRQRSRVVTFLGHVVDELRRVQWPDRRQTGQGTAVVLGFVVIAGSYLGLMDAIWKPLVEAIL